MKTARQYAEEAAFWVESQSCVLGYHELKRSGDWKPEHAERFRDHTAKQMLKTIPLEALVKCAAIVLEINARIPRCRSGSCPPMVRLSQPIRARITEALEEIEREEGK